MKLWIGAEMDADVGDAFRAARKAVEASINRMIDGKDYGLPIASWDCIAIVRSDDKFAERTAFSKKQRDMDFRLRIDHAQFRGGSQSAREKMVFQMLQRSLDMLKSKAGDLPGIGQLSDDLLTVARDCGWLDAR